MREREPKVAQKWTIFRSLEQEGKKIDIPVVIDSESRDKLSKFVFDTIDKLESKQRDLKLPVSPFKSHARRRSQSEIKNIMNSRIRESRNLDCVLKALKGEDRKPIEFLEVEGKIVGFKIENIPPNGC